MSRACEAGGCTKPAEWNCDGRLLCAGHERLWHMTDDRQQFVEEYAGEDRLERAREEREQFR